ncbi:MAG: DUF424 family protein [Candidatus Aenigmatarchaeota archaeon]
MRIVFKMHRRGDETLLAMADANTIGKTFSDGKNSVSISPEFYGECPASEAEITAAIKEATVINALGKKSVGILVEMGIVGKADVGHVCGLPHVQIYFM